MKAVLTCEKDWEEFIVDSIAAGADLLLVCQNRCLWQKAIEVISRKSQQSPFFAKRLMYPPLSLLEAPNLLNPFKCQP